MIIDRDVKRRRDIDRAVQKLVSRLIEVPLGSFAAFVDFHLATVGTVVGADRALYASIDWVEGVASVVGEWSADGSRILRLPGGVPIDVAATLLGRLSRRETITLLDRSMTAEDRSIVAEGVRSWGLESAVATPVMVAGVLSGFVVIGWTGAYVTAPEEIDFIERAAGLLSARLDRENGHAAPEPADRSVDARFGAAPPTSALVDAVPDLLFEIDPEGRIVRVHAPEPERLWLPPDELIGRPATDIIGQVGGDNVGAEASAAIGSALRRLQRSGGLEIVEYRMLVAGDERRLECRLVGSGGGGVVVIVRDITGVAEREQALREQTTRLARANDELERAVQARDEFLASVSHELRTPLNAILGHAEMLLDPVTGMLTDRQRNSVTTIGSSGAHLLALIDDLLDLNRMNGEMASLDLRDVAVGELCRTALEMVRGAASTKGVRLEHIDASGDATILLDERRARQILLNLLDNAIKFTEPGGVVGLHTSRHGDEDIVFSVWDTGIGIAAEDHATVFEAFRQIDAGPSRRRPGSGLGLALVEQLVTLHGGEITLESIPDEGSRFTVRLPVLANPRGDV